MYILGGDFIGCGVGGGGDIGSSFCGGFFGIGVGIGVLMLCILFNDCVFTGNINFFEEKK